MNGLSVGACVMTLALSIAGMFATAGGPDAATAPAAAGGFEPGVFLQHGAMGVMALGFLALLAMFWRSDKRAEKYARKLDRREEQIEAMASAACQLREIAEKTATANQALADSVRGLATAVANLDLCRKP